MRHQRLNPEKYTTAESIRDFFMYELLDRGNRPEDRPTIIITGRPGPTGKSWLCKELCRMGYNAIEISESICLHVEYTDDKNHVIRDRLTNVLVVILNKRLEGM